MRKAARSQQNFNITLKLSVTTKHNLASIPKLNEKDMEAFLIASKSALNDLTAYERIKVVLGNCTCDLDSAVCSLVHGFFLYHELSDNDKKKVAIIPLMNVTEVEYRIKTEVIWFLRENEIRSTLITFRDQIDLHALGNEKCLELTLVDHHTLAAKYLQLANFVVEIIDHRPQDPAWSWPKIKITLDPVGSCATLVAQNILTKNPKIIDPRIRNLLRGPILVDTQNFSPEAGRAKELDHEVIRALETSEISLDSRDEIYVKIMKAKTDVTGLTGQDLLVKDLKIIDDVAFPGFPILVQKFMELPNALEDVAKFANGGSFTLVILLGMDLKGEKMRRDMGVFVPATSEEHEIVSRLKESDLGLELVMEKRYEKQGMKENVWKFLLYEQRNVRATRKQILPIIQSALAELRQQR